MRQVGCSCRIREATDLAVVQLDTEEANREVIAEDRHADFQLRPDKIVDDRMQCSIDLTLVNATYNRRFEAAANLSGAERYRAYARLDADLTRDAAPMLIFGNESSRDFFSARIGCQTYQPTSGMDLAALCATG
jgi:hypothetical protein